MHAYRKTSSFKSWRIVENQYVYYIKSCKIANIDIKCQFDAIHPNMYMPYEIYFFYNDY